jgi:uncharacterized protein YegP (UPF0339 family)
MYFEIYPSYYGLSRQWRWRLKAANHEIIAIGEAYVTQQGCTHAINQIKGTNAYTPVNFVNA